MTRIFSVRRSPSVMILTYDDVSGIGGSFSTIREEIDYLKRRYPTFLLARKPKGRSIPAVTLVTFSAPPLPINQLRLLSSLLVFLVKLTWHATRFRPTVFHAHDVYVGSMAVLAARILGARLVLNVHGPLAYEFGYFNLRRRNEFNFRDMLMWALVSKLERFAYRAADAVIVISDFERRFVEDVRLGNVFTINNGINLNVFRPVRDRNQLRESISLPRNKYIVTYVGRMVPKNGVLIVAESALNVLKHRDDVVFLFVGDGFAELECRRILAEAVSSHKAIFVGAKANPAPYYQASDLFVSHVSTLVEGIGLTALEAIACGVPVIVGSDELSSKRLGNHAYFVRKDDPISLASKILSVLQPRKRDEISAQLRDFAETSLSWDQTFHEYEKVLFQTEKA